MIAMSLLGAMALAQVSFLLWRTQPAEPMAPTVAVVVEEKKVAPHAAPEVAPEVTPEAASTPGATAAVTSSSTGHVEESAPKKEEASGEKKPEELLAQEAEKRFLASMPKPTPVPQPVQRHTPESIQAARVALLVNQARSLRDRGDISTALTRLREAQAIAHHHPQVISEMAISYEKLGLPAKAMEQWRRIYQIGEKAGIYYAAAEAKLRALDHSDTAAAMESAAEAAVSGSLGGSGDQRPGLLLGEVGTTDDTGNSAPQRSLKLRVPIHAVPGPKVEVGEVVIQVHFYDAFRDGTVVQTNASVQSAWVARLDEKGGEKEVDWSGPEAEVLEVAYEQQPPDFNERKQTSRNYFGYVVRVYYKGVLNASTAEPARLLKLFPPPLTLQTSDLPQ